MPVPPAVTGPARLRYYDVKDIAVGRCEPLIMDIKTNVAPAYWSSTNAVIEGRHGILIVRAPRPILDEIDRRLRTLRGP